MLKNSLLFTKYTTGKQLKNSCNKKCKIFRTLCLYEFEYTEKKFLNLYLYTLKLLHIQTKMNAYKYFHIHDEDLHRRLSFKK